METNLNENSIENEGIENITNIDRVIVIFEKFITLLNKESELLKQMKIAEIDALLPDKVKMMQWHNIFEQFLSREPNWLKSQEETKKQNLVQIYEKFKQTMEDLHGNLEKAVVVNQYIMKMIYEEVASQHQNETYNSTGQKKIGTFVACNQKQGIPIKIDEKI
ncbi:MAG: hypothetical protein J0H68_04065 [Sphingobacteriia bacterium]|nr:hypothetical protein [Sphingobacteriia bacterium]